MDNFVRDYLATALWAETVILPVVEEDLVDGRMDVNEDHPLHDIAECEPYDSQGFCCDDFTDEAVEIATADCSKFLELLEKAGLYEKALEYGGDDDIAHNFWLDRNGHGAGFWDGDYGDVGQKISDLIESNFSELSLIATESGKVEYL